MIALSSAWDKGDNNTTKAKRHKSANGKGLIHHCADELKQQTHRSIMNTVDATVATLFSDVNLHYSG